MMFIMNQLRYGNIKKQSESVLASAFILVLIILIIIKLIIQDSYTRDKDVFAYQAK